MIRLLARLIRPERFVVVCLEKSTKERNSFERSGCRTVFTYLFSLLLLLSKIEVVYAPALLMNKIQLVIPAYILSIFAYDQKLQTKDLPSCASVITLLVLIT